MGNNIQPEGNNGKDLVQNTMGIASAGAAAGYAVAGALGVAAAGPVAIGAGITALAYGIVKTVQDSQDDK
jgi:hypothetical protein